MLARISAWLCVIEVFGLLACLWLLERLGLVRLEDWDESATEIGG